MSVHIILFFAYFKLFQYISGRVCNVLCALLIGVNNNPNSILLGVQVSQETVRKDALILQT